MKVKKLFFLLCLFLIAGNAFTQTVHFKITKEDNTYQRVQAWLIPFYADAHLANIHLGWGFGAKVRVLDHLHFYGSFQKSGEEFDSGFRDAVLVFPVHNVDDQNLKVTKNLEAGVQLVFSDKIKTKPEKVNLRSSQYSTTFITPNLKIRKLTSLRGGINYYNHVLLSSELPNERIETDDYVFTLFGAYDAAGNELLYETNRLGWGVPLNMVTISAGFGFDKIVNTELNVTGYGDKYAKRDVSQYIEFLFAPVISIQDLSFDGKEIDVTGDGENLFGKNHFGFRYGLDYMLTRRTISFGAGIEIGYRPGWKGKGWFLNGKVYFPLVGFMRK